jgi:NADH-quinone oxidoreductase subunit E
VTGGVVAPGPPRTPPRFDDAQLAEVRRLQALYPEPRAALLPVLRMGQETWGHLTLEAEAYVASLFGLSPAHVHEVVTFYTLFYRRPVGRHVLAVCHNLSCALQGAEGVIGYLEQKLGVQAGETTPDGRVTLLRVECLCACETAPMMQVDDDYVGNLTPEKMDAVLGGLG